MKKFTKSLQIFLFTLIFAEIHATLPPIHPGPYTPITKPPPTAILTYFLDTTISQNTTHYYFPKESVWYMNDELTTI